MHGRRLWRRFVTSNGSFGFVAFSGTSAAAPGMAGVAALLDQQKGVAQGNLNPLIYSLAASVPSAFHDATVASSGVSGCSASTVSICNNSIPGVTPNPTQAGFTLGTGFDEATGLGSLDVQVVLNNYQAASRITPTVNVAPSPSSINTAQSLSVTVTVSGGSGNPTPTGSVTLTSGSYASAATALVAGSATITVPAGSLAVGVDALTATYSSDSNYNPTTGTHTVTVTQGPTFNVGGTTVTIAAGATTGNTSTITVQPSNGFTGPVTLTAVVTASPSGAQNPPTFSFSSPNPVSITSASAVTSTLTISTIASKSSCTAANEIPRGIPWYARGGAVLACVLLFGIAPRRRKVRAILGMLLLFVALVGGMLACGGGGGSTACTNVVTPGTTAGSYTVTVTGTGPSGSPVATNTIALTVQ